MKCVYATPKIGTSNHVMYTTSVSLRVNLYIIQIDVIIIIHIVHCVSELEVT